MAAVLRAARLRRRRLSRLKAIFCGGAPLPAALVETYLARRRAAGQRLRHERGRQRHAYAARQKDRRRPIRDAWACQRHSSMPASSARTAPMSRTAKPANCGCAAPRSRRATGTSRTSTGPRFADGWFRTGDAGAARGERLLPPHRPAQGYVYFSGGENVYPAEVEAAFCAHPGRRRSRGVRRARCPLGRTAASPSWCCSPAARCAKRRCSEPAPDFARYKHPAHLRIVDDLPGPPPARWSTSALRNPMLEQKPNGPNPFSGAGDERKEVPIQRRRERRHSTTASAG